MQYLNNALIPGNLEFRNPLPHLDILNMDKKEYILRLWNMTVQSTVKCKCRSKHVTTVALNKDPMKIVGLQWDMFCDCWQ